jgi:hypothetical protein
VVEAAVSAKGIAHSVRVQPMLLYVLTALAALGFVGLSGGRAGSENDHDLIMICSYFSASIKVAIHSEDQPKSPGNGVKRTALGTARNQPVPSETEAPHRRECSTDEAGSNLSA